MAKVAVISDDQEFIDQLVDVLDRRGHDSVQSQDLAEVLAFVQREEPDIVTLSGPLDDPIQRISLVGFAGANSVLGKQPILVFTTVEPEEFGQELRDLEEMNVHFLRKPLEEDKVGATLERVSAGTT